MKFYIREQRKKKYLTLEQLSRLTGISKSYISEIEREIKMPSVEILCRIAKALNISVKDLFDC